MSSSNDQIIDAIKSAGIEISESLIDKVKETLRKMQNKLSPGALGKAESSRTLLAIEIACRQTGTMFERGQLRHSSVGDNEYQKALNTTKAILGISNFRNVADILSMQFSQALVEESKPILAKYETLCVRKMPAEMKRYVDISSPLYVCASFYVAALIKKVKINKAALSTLAETTSVQFMNLVDAMHEVWRRKDTGSSQHEGPTAPTDPGPALKSSSSKGSHQTLLARQQSSLSSKVPPLGFSGPGSGSSSASGSSGSTGAPLSLKQSLAAHNNNAHNIALGAQSAVDSSLRNSSMTTSGSGSKRKYAPSVLERLHGRAEVENMHILLDSSNSSIGKSHSAVRLSSSISEKQKEVLLQAREEAERAEGVKRAEREAFEAWRDAKIAEKRAKKDFNIASC